MASPQAGKPIPISQQLPLPKMTGWRQILLYLMVALGVFASPFLTSFKAGKLQNFTFDPWQIALCLIIALVVAPYAFEKLKVHPDASLIMQMGLFTQQGIFWAILIAPFFR